MARSAIIIFSVYFLFGCATAEIGMSISEFKKNCRNASWKEATEIALDESNTIVVCSVTGAVKNPQYQLFENGVLERTIPESELIAMVEDSKCRSFGATPNTDAYVNCRVSLAQMRAQAEANEQLRRQNAAQYLLTLQALQQPRNVNITANCTATTIGNITSYSCR